MWGPIEVGGDLPELRKGACAVSVKEGQFMLIFGGKTLREEKEVFLDDTILLEFSGPQSATVIDPAITGPLPTPRIGATLEVSYQVLICYCWQCNTIINANFCSLSDEHNIHRPGKSAVLSQRIPKCNILSSSII